MGSELDELLDSIETRWRSYGGYMPALSTFLRVKADEMADKYPDEANGGFVTTDSTQRVKEGKK